MESYVNQRTFIIDAFSSLIKLAGECKTLPNKEIHTVKLMSVIDSLALHTENLWINNAAGVDIFNRNFLSRRIQTGILYCANKADAPQVPDAAALSAKSFRLTREQVKAKKAADLAARYDIRATLQSTMDVNYIDERGPASRRPLESWRYNELINDADMIYIIKSLQDAHYWGPLLMLISILATTKEFVHFIVQPEIAQLIFAVQTDQISPLSDTSSDYAPAIQHILLYTMRILYNEETYLRSYVNNEHRCAIDLDTAAILPVYADCTITNSPYIPLSISPQHLELVEKSTGVLQNSFKNLRAQHTGFYNTQEFKRRFNVFTSGMFEGMNFDRLYVCGSVIPACAVKSPLEMLFMDQSREDMYMSDENLLNYFEEYYPSLRYVNHVGQSAEVYEEIESAVSDVDLIVHVVDDNEFDKYANRILKHVQDFLAKASPTATATLKRLDTTVSYKYYLAIDGAVIRAPGIEIFRVFEVHPYGAVCRFHIPAVRGIFNGRDVKVFPSMITYAMTGYLLDFRWIACGKNAKDIIIRYYIRGAQLICNETEMEDLAVHVATSPEWAAVAKYLRPGYIRDINCPLYKPRSYGHTIWSKLAAYSIPQSTPVKYNWISMPDNKQVDDNVCRANVPQFASIRYNNGAIQPLCLYLIRAYAESLGRSLSWS